MGLVLFPFDKMKDDWYYYDKKEHKYKLTDKCPEEGKKIYEQYIQTKKNLANALKGKYPKINKQ